MNQAACIYEREYVHINSEQIALKTFFRAPLKVALFGFFEPLEFWRFLFCCVEVSSPGRGNEGTKGFPGFYFSILIWNKTNNMSLRFKIGKFRGSGFSIIIFLAVYFSIFLLRWKNNLSLGFRVGKFCDGGLLDIVYISFLNVYFK